MKQVLAKGASDNYMSLKDHTEHVVIAIEGFARIYGFNPELARQGAILHDLGKAHPAFQAMLIEQPKATRKEWLSQLPASDGIEAYLLDRDLDERPIYRHELGSLGFLSLFPEENWPLLIEMVVGHHKSVKNDKTSRGILDLAQDQNMEVAVLEPHLRYWEGWSDAALSVVSAFDYPVRKIDYNEAKANFHFAFDYVKNIEFGWSPYRGLLMSADHFASGFKYTVSEELEKLFHSPDLSSFEERIQSPKAHLYPLSDIAVDDARSHTLVTAPTGAGKTDFLVRRCKHRIFYTLPFQASINAMFKRFKDDIPAGDIRRLHAASGVSLEYQADDTEERIDLQRLPGASVKVMTPHQLASLVFCTPGHEAMALDVRGQDVILDEVHTYSEQSGLMILKIVQALLLHDCRVHIGTATLPQRLKAKLLDLLGGHDQVYEVALPVEMLDSFDRHIIEKKLNGVPLDEDNMYEVVAKSVAAQEKLIIVANRVRRAQEWYIQMKALYPDIPIVLIHSRFRRIDRATLEKKVMDLQKAGRPGAAIAIATQVVEVSLDISYDRMITEAAPLDALIQRFGRVNRRRNDQTIGKYKSIHLLAPKTDRKEVLPYNLDTVQLSYEVLPEGTLLRERDVQQLMDQVFDELPDQPIPIEYVINEQGEYLLEKLRHQPKSNIVQVLAIDGDSCILASQQQEYRNASRRDQPKFEIPVPGSFKRYNQFEIEESGSYPIVIPDELYQFREDFQLGLVNTNDIPIDQQML
jgi:CRISPR-associated endonuclease/helicase Cas3